MPFGKNQRLDPRRSSPYCSTTTIVVLVALCLVGVWMMTSSTVVPVDVPADSTNTEQKQEISEKDATQFQDSNGDIPTDVNKGDTNTVSNNIVEATSQVDTSTKESEASRQESVATSEKGTYSDPNGKPEDGVTVKSDEQIIKEAGISKSEDENKNTGGQEDNTGKVMENNTNENKISEQEQNGNMKSDQAVDNIKSDQADGIEQINANTIPQDSTEAENNGQGYNTIQENKSNGDTTQASMQEESIEENKKDSEENSQEKKPESHDPNVLLPSGAHSELLNETNTQSGAWSTQASESKNEKEVQASLSPKVQIDSSSWKLCNATAGPDYIPCLDNEEAIKTLRTTRHYEHRERHCPEEPITCLVPLPEGYRRPIEWPASRDKIWYHNVPHTELAAVKGHQNWVKVSGEYLTFPGGGTQFIYGALHYIDVIQEAMPDIAWGKRSRVVLDVGCGVASFGGYLFDRDVLTMSFAPKDEHEAQVQFALERGIPAISAVMGTKRLPYPGRVFDVIHCARCRVPWHIEGGKLLLELNRLLRPGGYFVWSATPVYQDEEEDVQIWNEMSKLMKSMCWDMVAKTKDTVDKVGLAIYRKPSNNSCYEKRNETSPPLCPDSDDPNAAWNVPLQTCMHKFPVDSAMRGSQWPVNWPVRLTTPPYWLNSSQTGVYGKPAPEDFKADQEHWNTVVTKSYMSGMGIDWSRVRNIMDMRAVYGGFASALKDMKVWVMNIVSIDSPDTLPIIYERGLFGMYHDWCESFSTYPRSYDLLHADHLFSRVKKKCKILPLMVEVDRMLRPEGKLIVRDTVDIISEVESIAKSLKWEIRMTFSKKNEGILCVMKTAWRPKELN